MSKHTYTLEGPFGYAVSRGEPGVDLRTNEPVGQIRLFFVDQQTGDEVVALLGDDAARDLAQKVIDTLRQPGVLLLPTNGRGQG